MTEDEFLKLAEDAGCGWRRNGTQPVLVSDGMILRFARLVAAAERERCAKVCEELRNPNYSGETGDWIDGTEACATAIRALGDEE